MRYVYTSLVEPHRPNHTMPWVEHVANMMQIQLTSETQSVIRESRRGPTIWT